MKTKGSLRLLTILMSLMMVFVMMPQFATPAHATGSDGMVVGTEVLADGANTEYAQTVYMADKAWKVIGYNGAGVASDTDIMTLFSARNISEVQFRADRDAPDAKHYSKSNLKTEVEAVAETFSDGEKSGIVARDLESGTHDWDNERGLDCIAGDEVKGALLWPLSTKEALAMDWNLRRLESNHWWLRSPTCYNFTAGIMNGSEHPDGNYYGNGISVNNISGLRPAFNFNLKSAIFTTAVEHGKPSAVGPNTLTVPSEGEYNDWKLTLKDEAHRDFKIESVTTCDGKTLNIKYSGAAKSDNEYISAIIKDSDGNIQYYGKLALASDETGAAAAVNIDGKMRDGYTLCIFNEQCNGDDETDFSSPLKEITIPTEVQHDWGGWTVNNEKHWRTCSVCGEGEDGAEHVWTTEWYADEDNHWHKCIGCGIRWDTTAHTVETDEEVDATCTETGLTAGKHCSVCNKVLEAQETVPALGHKYDAWTKLDDKQHQRVCEHNSNHVETASHSWDAGKVTKQATTAATGVKTYTCTTCKGTKTESIPKLQDQKGSDGTAVGPGASSQAAEKTITTLKKDADPKGAVFARIQLKSPSQTKTSVKISWKKTSGATKYVIYGNACGTKNKMKKLATVTGTSKNFTKVAGKKVKKGTYYKFMVVALNKNNKVVSTSKMIHVATKGGKVGNHKSVTVKIKVGKKTKAVSKVTVGKGKTLALKTSLNPVSKKLKVKKHVGVRYESSNIKIATVNGSGKITAKAKGTCYIYAYAQNGVMKAVKVTVK